MNLTPDAEARRLDPAITRTWDILATIRGEATEYRVCWSYEDDTYHVIEQPDGPGVVVLAVSEHGDYVSALRGVAAYVEEQEVAAGRHAADPFDIRPRLRIRRTWDCTVGEHAGLVGVGLEPLFVTAEELRQLQAAFGSEGDA